MAKLYFYYGVMGSSKSAQALMCNFNYKLRGQHPILAKADLDTRDGDHVIRTRIGIEEKCYLLSELEELFCEKADLFDKQEFFYSTGVEFPDVVIVDEAQFATPAQIDFLSDLVDDFNIPVVCYGLRTDFKGEFFPGSMRLMEIADTVSEIKTTCWCGKKAIINARFHGDEIMKEGEQIMLGGDDMYIPLCRKHFKQGQIRSVYGLGTL